MGEFEQIQTRKAISAYGGVGSIFETRDGAIMIQPFDKWPFFQKVESHFQDHNFIEDKRFKNRISKYFKNLEYLVKVPVNDLMFGYKLTDGFSLLSARYFPEWFYCNSCKKFDKFPNWKYNWDNNVDTNDKDKFFPPKCHKCYKSKSKKGKWYDLEQVRFILTAPNGDMVDIPWDKWAMLKKAQKENKESEEESEITLGNIFVPKDIELSYHTSNKLDDLKGIGISAKNSKGEQLNYSTLSGLFSLRMRIEELIPNTPKKDILFKPVIRTSNSVYYPNILSSIYLPSADELNENTINQIKDAFEDGENATQIKKNLKRYKFIDIEVNTIQKLIDNNFSERDVEISKTENEYRHNEYKFVTSRDEEKIPDLLIFEKIDTSFFQSELIKSIYKMDKIKITSVQTSFTRQEPISSDLFLKDDSEITETKEKIKKKFTSTYGVNTKYLPAVESFGEGIFFEFDNEKLKKWLKENPQVTSRISTIIENHLESESSLNKELKVTPKFILIHTFSHLIIKELEYLAGYPATSIQERLYIDNELKMQGVLIYTVAGSEGSYGGLTSICDNEKIGNLIQSAIIRANDCATDPICYHTSGQGVGNLNLSACFNCTLLPETSCEMFNSFLDRRILIDNDYGYFRSINTVK
ncbi:MAG: DUF1998 domain-containing protein [Flavobacteriaceae bacterium]|nr:DUF1998 domain-containing protein [Flavobacteriaceae bacterium]